MTIKLSELPASEVKAMHEAEQEALRFYEEMEAWDNECERLTTIHEACRKLLAHSAAAVFIVSEHLKDDETLTGYEHEILMKVASSVSEDGDDHKKAIAAFGWMKEVHRAYVKMRNETIDDMIGLPNKLILKMK